MPRLRALTPLEIRRLNPADAELLAAMLRSDSSEYQRYFAPFPFEPEPIRRMLTAARQDVHWGLFAGGELAGFFMLRGFDEGYSVPAYGVSVAERFSNRGLLKLSLSFAAAWCRFNGVDGMMLKVHPDNVVAKRAYERFGFRHDRIDVASGQLVYYLDLTSAQR